jgi:hypothetical protein
MLSNQDRNHVIIRIIGNVKENNTRIFILLHCMHDDIPLVIT